LYKTKKMTKKTRIINDAQELLMIKWKNIIKLNYPKRQREMPRPSNSKITIGGAGKDEVFNEFRNGTAFEREVVAVLGKFKR